MAKYTVDHKCGHSQVHELFGPGKERERKLEWFAGQPCTECWKAQKRAEEEAAGPAFYARATQGGAEVVCWRQSYQIKDQLKARGYRFGEVYRPAQTRDLVKMMMAEPTKGWSLRIKADGQELEAKAYAEIDWIKAQGWEIKAQNVPDTLIASVVEGRPDLLPASN